ncbi:MAG: UDP-N-acetylglucosamine 2-epimerase (non-hydrolyzing) [Planctomycetota bacterium]
MPLKILFVLGTRPEAIKLCPVVRHLRARPDEFAVRVCATAQHREMLDSVLDLFEVVPDNDLDLMKPGQDLFDVTAGVIQGLKPVLEQQRPDWVLVQGDTTTVWTAALAAFYEGVRVGHVEAGLRTHDKRQPFPEEINRRLCTQLADLHFAPTPGARENLLAEAVPAERVVVTGNTVIDALQWVLEHIEHNPPADVEELRQWVTDQVGDRQLVLITGHRRESFGAGFENICRAIANLAEQHPYIHWIYPVHLNPNVQRPVRELLSGRPNVHLLDPLPYAPFAWLMRRSTLILTDSGGIQEEAPSLGKFVFVMRNTTERPEGVQAGCVKLVGNSTERIIESVAAYLSGDSERRAVPDENPYGDGQASRRIAEALLRFAD